MNTSNSFGKRLHTCVILLTGLSVPMLIIGAELSSNTIGKYGFVDSVSFVYIAGFACCLAALGLESVTGFPSKGIMWFNLILSAAYLWIGPIIIFPGLPMPAEGHDLQYYSTSASIISSGHLNPQIYIYQSWPGAYIFFAIVKLVFPSVSYVQLYRLVPMAYNLFAIIVTYCFSRSFAGRRHVAVPFIAAEFMQLFNFSTTLTSVSPFSFPFLLFYAMVFLSLSLKLEGRTSLANLTIVFTIFILSLSTIHPEIAFVSTMAIFGIFVFSAMKREISPWRAIQIPIIGLSWIAVWIVVAAESYFRSFGLSDTLQSLFNIASTIIPGTVGRLAGVSPAYATINSIKLALFLILAVGMLPIFIKHIIARTRNYLVILSVVIFAGVSFIVVGGAQGNDYPVRIFAYLLPVIVTIDAVSIFRFPKKILMPALVLVLLVSVPISLTVVYGDLSADYVPPPSIQSSIYFSSYVPPNQSPNVILSDQSIGDYGNNLSTIYPFSYAVFPVNPVNSQPDLQSNTFQFVALGQLSIIRESFLISNGSNVISMAMEELSINPNYDTVYSNGMVVLYSNAG